LSLYKFQFLTFFFFPTVLIILNVVYQVPHRWTSKLRVLSRVVHYLSVLVFVPSAKENPILRRNKIKIFLLVLLCQA
jgi:hypothetical protein